MRKNQKPNQVNDPWYIPAVPTGKSEFGAPNCPVRALSYYHRYLTEHPEPRKDRRRLFVPVKDNNAGKEFSAPTKARRWSSGNTFTSFYLRDLCPQADSLQRAGPIVAAVDVVRFSSS